MLDPVRVPRPEAPPVITIVIASAVRLYSEGLRQCLCEDRSAAVLGIAQTLADVRALVCALRPSVLLLDQAMPGGLDLVRELRLLPQPPRVVALGMPDQEDTLLEWAEAGVAGLVPREASVEDLVSTLGHAVRGEFRCSPRFAGQLLSRLTQPRHSEPAWTRPSRLTAREMEIVHLIDRGLSNKEIAVELGIELATVKNHVHNLLEKLHVHRRGEAAARLRTGAMRFTSRVPPPTVSD